MRLDDRALLVQLNISYWAANKLDKEISKETSALKGSVDGAIRAHKSLLPSCEHLENIRRKASLIRTLFYDNTLPWGTKGTQILPTANYLAFMTEFRQHRAEYDQLVDRFIPDYPQLVQDAKVLLGSSYKPTDYPPVEDIRDKFKMDMVVMPVPTDDFRVNIANDELERIQADVVARTKSAAQEAMADVWQRLYDRVKHLADKLDDPKAVFRDSTVVHLQDLCNLLPRLNFAGDPQLEAMRKEVEGKLVGYNADILRSDPQLRRDTATEAKGIMDKMAVFMGQQGDGGRVQDA